MLQILKSISGERFQYTWVILIFAFFFIFSGGFYSTFLPVNMKIVQYAVALFVILLYLFKCFNKKNKSLHFADIICLFIIIRVLSAIPAEIINDQAILTSLVNSITTFVWLLYFVLHRYKVKESSILQGFYCLAIAILLIQIVQQLSPYNALFGITTEDGFYDESMIEKRNGLYRFRLGVTFLYHWIIFFFVISQERGSFIRSKMLIVVLMLVSVYLTLTRQAWACTLFGLAVFAFMSSTKRFYKLIAVLGFFVLIIYFSAAFVGDLAEQTKGDLTKENIRLFSYSYFLENTKNNPLSLFLGNGYPAGKSNFSIQMQSLQEYGLFTSDVGIVGSFFHNGLAFVFVQVLLFWRILITYRKRIPAYIRLVVISSIPMAAMMNPLPVAWSPILWLLYVCDLHINKSPLAKR